MKVSNSVRFREFKYFKVQLTSIIDTDSLVFCNGLIIGKGLMMASKTGKKFRVYFNTKDQQDYVINAINIEGRSLILTGKHQEENLYVIGIRHLTATLPKLIKRRESANVTKITMQQRYHNNFIATVF